MFTIAIGQGASCSPTVLGHSDTTEELTVSRGERFGFYAYYSSCLNEVWSSETSSNLSTSPSYNITEEIFFEHYITSKLSSIAQLSSSGQYYFTVSNNIGQSYTLTFQLRVESESRYLFHNNNFFLFYIVTPELTIIPRKLNAAQGDNASLICEAVGSPLPSVISWYYNGILISPSPPSIKNEEKHTVTSTLLFQPLRREDEGYYYCSSYNYISQGRRAGNSPQVFTNVYCKYIIYTCYVLVMFIIFCVMVLSTGCSRAVVNMPFVSCTTQYTDFVTVVGLQSFLGSQCQLYMYTIIQSCPFVSDSADRVMFFVTIITHILAHSSFN